MQGMYLWWTNLQVNLAGAQLSAKDANTSRTFQFY